MKVSEIKRDLIAYNDGSAFIKPGKLSAYFGDKNMHRVKQRWNLEGLQKVNGYYFIGDIAERVAMITKVTPDVMR